MDRRSFMAAAAGAAALSRADVAARPVPPSRHHPTQPQPDFELEDVTITQLVAWMKEGRYTSRTIAELYQRRILDLNTEGPRLRAVIEINPEALDVAGRLDEERRAGHERGPLHGVPILVKDNLDTADRMHTSAGSLALAASVAPRDSFVVERLRAAGAIIIGKANMSEWANFRGKRSISGWSARGGQCRNPYALDRQASGSSSGSGVATAASMCAAAIGTETDGSITSPANMCSLVGIKPTVGLVSRAGIIPISASQDTAGPMARTVSDAAILLGAITGEDPRDRATRGSSARGHTDYTRFLDADGLRGARLGLVRKRYVGMHFAVDRVFEEALGVLRERGAVIVDNVDLVTEDHLGDAETTVLYYEYKKGLNDYLAALGAGAPMKTLADVIAFNQQHADVELAGFGQEHMIAAQAKGPLTAQAYRTARARCVRWARTLGIDAVMRQHRVQALICPTSLPARPIDPVMGDSGGGDCTTPAAVAGYPHLTVPMGYVDGLPVGLSFFGLPWTEGRLIQYAYAFEQARQARRPPRYLATVEVGN